MKLNRSVKYLLGAAIVISLSACSEKTDKTLQSTPIQVEAGQVKRSDSSEAFTYSGTIEESESIPLSFSTVGNVSHVLVAEGDFVKKGQLLAELNSETFNSAYQMSLATQKQAEDAYKRLLPMYKNGNLPEIKLVEVETGLQQAKAAASIAKKNLDDCKLYSPVDGIIGKRSIDPGMTALPNLTSITIVKIGKVFARVSISENEISTVKKNTSAKIKIAALDNAEFTGTVEEIGVIADPIAHTYKIKLGINNRDGKIKPGMICVVTLNKKESNSVLVVESSAVLVDETGRNFVYAITASHDKAVRKYIKTGKLLNSCVEVIEGLTEGEKVVIAGQQKLVDNSPVHISNR